MNVKIIASLFTLLMMTVNALAQCAMCKESVANASDGVAKGFNYGVLAMVFLPATLVSGVSLFVIRASYLKKHPGSNLSTLGILRESFKERRAGNL